MLKATMFSNRKLNWNNKKTYKEQKSTLKLLSSNFAESKQNIGSKDTHFHLQRTQKFGN